MEEFTKVLVLQNESEARLLDAVLKERAIPHLMRTYHDRAYDGLWQAQYGWGHVEAPVSRHREIREIYEDLSSRPPESGGAEGGQMSGEGSESPEAG
jgi:hypothetical protein